MDKHWTEKLFIDEANLFGETLEKLLETTDTEIEGLINIFSEYNIQPGGTILDLACGIGRHSIPLAKKGYKVVGIDISPTYIARAKEYAKENDVSKDTEFTLGDMRHVEGVLNHYKDKFDAVVNLFTSMGYWDEETDRKIFYQVLKLTKRNGIFVIHTANRDYLVRHFQAKDVNITNSSRVIFADRRLDLETSRMFNVWKYYNQRDEDLKHLSTIEIDHRIYSLHELKKQLEDSGWNYQKCYGGYDMRPFTTDTFSMIMVSKNIEKHSH